jgi:hypothetical protein
VKLSFFFIKNNILILEIVAKCKEASNVRKKVIVESTSLPNYDNCKETRN